MKTYKVKAKVLNLGSGEQVVERTIEAENIVDAYNIFIEQYLTIEVLAICIIKF